MAVGANAGDAPVGVKTGYVCELAGVEAGDA